MKHMEDLEERRVQLSKDKFLHFEAIEKENEKKLKGRMNELENLYKRKVRQRYFWLNLYNLITMRIITKHR